MLELGDGILRIITKSTVTWRDEGVAQGDAAIVDVTGAGAQVTVAGGVATLDISGATGAPSNASYICTAAEAGLSAEKVLGDDVIMRGLAANKPAASIAGLIYIETDGSLIVWRDNGTTWDEIGRGEAGMRLAQLSEKAHGSLTGVGATDHHTNANDPSADEKAALAGTDGVPSGTNKYVTDSDSRNSDARTPTAHESGHEVGGSDALVDGATAPADIAGSAATGTATKPPRQDHAHAHPATLHQSGGAVAHFVYTSIVLGDSSDPLTTGTDKNPIPMEAPCTLTIVEVRLKAGTGPAGAAIIVDVNKNGTTIFTTQANRPQIAAGATEGNSTTIDVTGLVKGDNLSFDIDQVGSTTAGSKLMVEIICKQYLQS